MDDWNNEHQTMFRCEVAWKENGTRHETRRACSYLSRFRRRSEQRRAAGAKDHRRSSAEARGGSAGHSGGQRGEFPTKHLQRGRPYIYIVRAARRRFWLHPPQVFICARVPPNQKVGFGDDPGPKHVSRRYVPSRARPRPPHKKSSCRLHGCHKGLPPGPPQRRFYLFTRHMPRGRARVLCDDCQSSARYSLRSVSLRS